MKHKNIPVSNTILFALVLYFLYSLSKELVRNDPTRLAMIGFAVLVLTVSPNISVYGLLADKNALFNRSLTPDNGDGFDGLRKAVHTYLEGKEVDSGYLRHVLVLCIAIELTCYVVYLILLYRQMP